MSPLRITLATLLSMIICQIAQAGIYMSGHADIGAGFEDDNLHLHLHADTDLQLFGGGTVAAGSELEAGEHMIAVPGPPTARPSGSQWDFLAPNAGDSVWFLPASSPGPGDPIKPFLGIGTEELSPSDGWTTPLTWTFNSITTVSGDNSAFAIWHVDSFGGLDEVFASSLLPTAAGNSWTQNPDSHEHFVFGFTGEGIYDVSFSISGINAGTGLIDAGTYSDTASFRFITGSAVPEPSGLMLLGLLSAGGTLYRRR